MIFLISLHADKKIIPIFVDETRYNSYDTKNHIYQIETCDR